MKLFVDTVTISDLTISHSEYSTPLITLISVAEIVLDLTDLKTFLKSSVNVSFILECYLGKIRHFLCRRKVKYTSICIVHRRNYL